MERNTCNGMWHDCETTNQITIQVNDIFNGMTFIAVISITMPVLIACLDILINIFDRIDSNLDKLSEYQCGYYYDIDTITITNTWYKIRDAVLIVTLFLSSIYFTIKTIDGLPINITLFIEFDVIIVVLIQLMSILAVQSSIGAVDCDTQVIYNVCCVYFITFFIFCLFPFF